jgi:predicted alpha/beta hydrolase
MSAPTPVAETPARAVPLRTADGTTIQALHHAAQAPIKGHLVVAGATAVPQRFYRRFAQHAAANGYATLTLDYRGVGLSKPPTLKGYAMRYLDWVHQDLASAVDWLAPQTTAAAPLFMVGHSFGGHAYGLLRNQDQVARLYTFGTGAGWHGWMPALEQVRVLTMWKLLGPLLTRWKGYLPWSLLGMGEDLPLGVYRDWRRWCQYPRYFFDDPALAEEAAALFARVTAPIQAANALDDHWAPPASRDAFMAAYCNTAWLAVDLNPKAMGQAGIGHMGYFRPSAMALWDDVLAWFDQHPRQAR